MFWCKAEYFDTVKQPGGSIDSLARVEVPGIVKQVLVECRIFLLELNYVEATSKAFLMLSYQV